MDMETRKAIVKKIALAAKRHQHSKFPMLRIQVMHPHYGWQTTIASNDPAIIMNDFLFWWREFNGSMMICIDEIAGKQTWANIYTFDPAKGGQA